ncbi:BCCT family transporter [Streptomyces sulphureus]|uniref:BCCT family transporter n=1 Tax=Streptomyces sulphureus TaxID=47758 RepID=UPI0003A7B77A|nr:BCCT family transporter [Streptomyces sulphureus]
MAAQQTGKTREAPPEADENRPSGGPKKRESSVAPWVFWPSAIIIVAFVLYAVIFQESAANLVTSIQDNIVGGLSWYYMAIVSLFVIFSLWVGIGRFGDIKLGKDHEKAEYSLLSWLSMLFAAGMGIGLVFWGVAEPLNFYDAPKPGVGESPADRAEFSMVQTFLHWGIHPWAIYVVVGLAVAYAIHRKGRPVSIRWALEPVLGNRVKGWLGNVIDVIAVVGTLFGVATSLGFGVMQISAGLDFSGWVENPGQGLQVALIIGITVLATISVVTGIGKGIKWLSNINMGLAAALMLFILVAGPTLFIFSGFIQNIGGYLQTVLQMSFDTGASQGSAGTDWTKDWTIFYWGWWISWSPFVGIFIARISRGRTVREFVCGVLLVPTLLTFFWYSVLGGSGIHTEVFGEGGLIGDGVNDDTALFQLLETLPAAGIVIGLTILLIVLFFVTSSDSGSYVVDMLTSGGDPDPPRWSRVFWSCAEGAVAIALLVAGGKGTDSLTTLQTTAIIIALPFSVVMLFMCAATIKSLRHERQAYLKARQEAEQDLMIDKAVSAIEESLENGTLETPIPAQQDGEQANTSPSTSRSRQEDSR